MPQSTLKDEVPAEKIDPKQIPELWSLEFHPLIQILVILPFQFLPQNSCFTLEIKATLP